MIPTLVFIRQGPAFLACIWRGAALEQVEILLEKVGLGGKRTITANALSHGDQRLLEVAVALAVEPALLFLDEPTAGMNPEERVQVLKNIRQLSREGETIFVLVEHDMDVVFSLSERVIVLTGVNCWEMGVRRKSRRMSRSGKSIWEIRLKYGPIRVGSPDGVRSTFGKPFRRDPEAIPDIGEGYD